MKVLKMVILTVFLFTTVSFAADCTQQFSWLPNSEDDIAGYKIYYGLNDEGPYTGVKNVGNPAPIDGRIWGEVTGLVCGELYYFVCRAYNTATVESDNSIQIDFVVTVPDFGNGGDVVATFGSAPGADYAGTIQDTYINIGNENNVTNQQLNTYTWPENMAANAIILKVDLSQLPEGAQVQSASLQLYTIEAGGDSGYDISVHKIINYNPDLSTTTGYTYDGTNSWTADTSSYNSIPMAQADIGTALDVVSVDSSVGYNSWNVTGMVKDWMASPGSNYGLLLNSDTIATADSYRNFASSEATEASQRPKLVVTYTVDGTPVQISSPVGFELLN